MDYIYITGALIIIGGLLDFFYVSQRKKISNRLGGLLEKSDFDTFDQEINKASTKFFLPVYNINFMKLTAAVRRDRYEEAKTITDAFEKATLKKNEIYSVFVMAFNYFVYKEDKEYSTKSLEKLRTVVNDDNKSYIDSLEQIYRIYIKKDDRDLDTLLKQNKNMPDEYKYASDYLIAKIYENRKDRKNMEKYMKAGEAHYSVFQQKFKENYINNKNQ